MMVSVDKLEIFKCFDNLIPFHIEIMIIYSVKKLLTLIIDYYYEYMLNQYVNLLRQLLTHTTTQGLVSPKNHYPSTSWYN